MLTITHTATDPNTATEGATAILTMENGSIVKLGLSRAYLYKSDDNGDNEQFINDWENMQTVKVLSGGAGTQMSKDIALPWASMSLSSLPQEITTDIKKEDGWSMAFCVLNKMENANYFGLYNKYLGILRVFSYIEEAAGNTSDYVFEVNMGSSTNDPYHAAYYNALQYGIPMCHSRLASNIGTYTVNGSRGQAFRMFTTPYNATSSTALQKGWTAFDIDMSAYSPDYNFFGGKATDTGLIISLKSWGNAAINMQGNLSANITGEYDEPSTKVTTSGIGTLVNMLKTGGTIVNAINSAIGDISKLQKSSSDKHKDDSGNSGGDSGNGGAAKDSASHVRVMANTVRPTRSITATMICVGAAIKIGTAIYDQFFSDASVADTKYTRGQIDLNLQGNIALTGSITQSTSNNIPVLQFQKSEFLHADESHFGEGTWSLEDDPVVYIVKDRCLSASHYISLVVEGSNTYNIGGDAKDNELRMINFFDPTTVKVNINEELYGKVSNVVVDTYYGVYPYSDPNGSDMFRSVAGVTKPSSYKLVDPSGCTTGDIVKLTNRNDVKQAMYSSQENFKSTYYGETTKARLISHTASDGRVYCYYGYCEDFGGGVSFMPDPQCYFPIDSEDMRVYDDYIPDFVVNVLVSFQAGGKTYIFSRNYVPKIVEVSRDELKTHYDALTAYSNKCKNLEYINTLGNDSSVGVIHKDGDGHVQKSLDILKYVMNN